MALVSIKDAGLGYEGRTVVRNVSFSVQEGDYLCIVGENGSGKTTLMKAILGLLSPIEGKIEFGDGLRQNEIGYLPQQTQVQKDFPASVSEIVLSGCLNRCGLRPFYNRSERESARANMQSMGIEDLAGRCYRELSGGQQQRVLLARAMCATRKMLLLDEPAAVLDPRATQDMYTTIEHLNSRHGITVIMISHDISSALKYASHILHLTATPLFYGRKEDYVTSDVCKASARLNGGEAQ